MFSSFYNYFPLPIIPCEDHKPFYHEICIGLITKMYIIYYVRAFFFAFIIVLLHSSPSIHCPKVLQTKQLSRGYLPMPFLLSHDCNQQQHQVRVGDIASHAQESALLSTSTHCLMNHMPCCSATTGILKAWQMLASISWELKLCLFLLEIRKMMLISHSSLANKVKEAPLQPLFPWLCYKNQN